ncbi:MAG: TIGR00266 family protein [Syntrophomonadaceae bacterium]|nr:TIGR00266 family protein [Syntrophomonadaceae bacterium]
MTFCGDCGNQIQEGVKFCPACGRPAQPGDGKPVRRKRADEVEFKIYGGDLQFVEIMLDPGETVVAEAGGMMYMDSAIRMDTIFGDGSGRDEGKGLMDKLVSAGKRVITGESLFMTSFTNGGREKKCVSFAAPYPGHVIPLDLAEMGGTLICQKDSFLCAAKGVSVGIAFQKKIGVGLFGGEGFIMQKLEGDGLVFMHAGGAIIKKELASGETLKLDTGCLVALTKTVNYDVQFSGDVKTALFGGEGLVLATLTGPGTVWLQSLPFSRMADRIISAGQKGGRGKEESSILGSKGIGTFFSND